MDVICLSDSGEDSENDHVFIGGGNMLTIEDDYE